MSFDILEQKLKSMNRRELTAFSLGETSDVAKYLEDGPVKIYLLDYLNSVKDAFENFDDSSMHASLKVFEAVMSELRKLSTKLDSESMEILFCNSIISSCCIMLSDNTDHFVEYSIATASNCSKISINMFQDILIRDKINRAVNIQEHFRK